MTEPAPLQFSLKPILAITAAIALFFAAGSWFGFAGCVGFIMLVALVGFIAKSRRRGPAEFEIFAACSLLMLIGSCLAPATRSAKEAARRSKCTSHLKQLGLALQNYYDVYKCFPPVCTTDANGKPMHSWRVLILPFMEQKALYAKYDLNEPWDGPHNRLLAKQMPATFRCPEDATNPAGVTDYVAIVGPETIWQPDQGTTFAEIKDGSSNTIAVIEAAGLSVNWMEPRDLQFAAVANGINPKHGSGISSHHPGGVIAMFADGHTQTIQENISLGTLKALFTKAGGEQIDEDY